MKIVKIIITLIILLLTIFIYVTDTANMILATKKGINVCLETIIPSLFGFMVISAFIINSGLYQIFFKPLYFIFKHIIRINNAEFAIFVLSLTGGYPVGAKLLSDYISSGRISPEIAKYKIPYLYCASPVFIISIVGISLYNDVKIGFIVYLSNALACLLFAVFMNIREPVDIGVKKSAVIQINQDLLINSILSTGKALFAICLTVVFFSNLNQILVSLNLYNYINDTTKNTIQSLMEISNITSFIKNNKSLLPIISALTSLGGFCIMTQVRMIVGDKINLKYFYLLRLPIAAVSGLICYFLTIGVVIPVEVSSKTYTVIPTSTVNPLASFALIIMVLIVAGSSVYENHYKKR